MDDITVTRYVYIEPDMYVDALATTLASSKIYADIVIIGNKSMSDNVITTESAKKLWLGKIKKLPDIGKVKILDQAKGSAIKGNFYATLTNKNSTQIKAYWAKIIFTGKAFPPKTVSSDHEVMEMVRNNKNVLGYVDSASVDDSVKVLLKIN